MDFHLSLPQPQRCERIRVVKLLDLGAQNAAVFQAVRLAEYIKKFRSETKQSHSILANCGGYVNSNR